MADDLNRLCEAHGIALSYHDIWGEAHATSEATKRALLEAMRAHEALPEPPPVERGGRCRTPPPGARLFGPAIQLYAIRSRRNWGIGDFTDLADVARLAASEGASFLGVNPLHELFLDRPAQASPYSPSTRLALNPLYIDVEAVDDYAACEEARALVASEPFRARIAALRAAPFVDHAGVWAAKREVLELLHAHFRRQGRNREDAFLGATHEHRRTAVFDALQERFAAWGWPAWPAQYRDRAQAEAIAPGEAVDFFAYLQWQADEQLRRAHAAALDAGMSIGLYRDLAVGANPGGAETWQDRDMFASGVHVGAPPDDFNRTGQDWGLPPWIPRELRRAGYAPWSALLRANMRHAGALRIDHVMGLSRLYWIPRDRPPTEGAYVSYPLDELCAVLANESVRQDAIVVGEDLGTVPDALRGTLRDAGVLSYRVLYFERTQDGGFRRPDEYPAQALVCVSTHDLPTLRGFLDGTDLRHREALGLLPSEELRDRLRAERERDRSRLREAMVEAGLGGFDDVVALHRYVARTPCALMTIQLEDVFGETEQANLPATSDDQHPNWRRKVGIELEDWAADGRFARLCAAIRDEGRGERQ